MNVYEDICKSLRAGKRVVSATIVAASGSTPATPESRMLVDPDDGVRTAGTIGGGCLDAGVIAYVRDHAPAVPARLMEIELNDDTGDTGLNCGGNVTVLIESLSGTMLPHYEQVSASIEDGNDCVLVTGIGNDGTIQKTVLSPDGRTMAGGEPAAQVMASIRRSLPDLLASQGSRRLNVGSVEYVLELIQSDPSLIIFGGGHIGKAVCQCASLAGFRVTVVDDRKEFANRERFPEARRTLCESFDAAFDRLQIGSSTYVVIVTRGHRHDEMSLESTLKFHPKYVGMIGSRRKVSGVFDHLRKKGISGEQLLSVHAPIGLPIGARTPGEIAISIVSELVKVRRSVREPSPPA